PYQLRGSVRGGLLGTVRSGRRLGVALEGPHRPALRGAIPARTGRRLRVAARIRLPVSPGGAIGKKVATSKEESHDPQSKLFLDESAEPPGYRHADAEIDRPGQAKSARLHRVSPGGQGTGRFRSRQSGRIRQGGEKARRESGQTENGVSGSGRGPRRRASPRPRQARQGEDQHGCNGRGDCGQPPLRRNFLGEAQGHRADVATARGEIAGTGQPRAEYLSAGGCWSA